MRISQRLDYALRALVLLATAAPGRHVAAGDLADRLGMPRRFVEQQVTALARAGVVECRRGASGGCSLARPAADITVREVVEALQGDVLDIPQQNDSASAEMWAGAQQAIAEFLGSATLEQLAVRQREIDATKTPMYYI
jgi:Rrf2 family protein